jgi:nucleoid-associated protein YgaU
VAPGDTLWDLAARDLPADASPAAVDRHWRVLWQVNRARLGPDPDVIQPGTILRLPPREDD